VVTWCTEGALKAWTKLPCMKKRNVECGGGGGDEANLEDIARKEKKKKKQKES